MKVTKRAKKVTVKYTETTSYYTEYTCPSCCITFKEITNSRIIVKNYDKMLKYIKFHRKNVFLV